MRRRIVWRLSAGALLLFLAFSAIGTIPGGAAVSRQDATPTVAASCDAVVAPPATPAMGGMEMGTPMAGMDTAMDAEFDRLYIDMMLPHHASIVAMAQAALPRLTDPRLREIAQTIIDTQTAEQAELRGYRERFYGSPEPAAMDAHTMEMMMAAMPGMG